MQITKEFLKSLDPCIDGFKWWCEKYGESVELAEFVKAVNEKWDYVRWLSVRCLTHKSQVLFSVWCAEYVIHLYKGPSNAPQKAIDAAKKWIEDPSEENAAAYSAASAAYAAASASAASAASAAAYAAGSASAASDDYAAAYAAASASAASAAYAAYAAYISEYEDNKNFKEEAMAYLLNIGDNQMQIKKTGQVNVPPKILIYGPEGVGKSTFGALAPNLSSFRLKTAWTI
jgi:hypothetical protein